MTNHSDCTSPLGSGQNLGVAPSTARTGTARRQARVARSVLLSGSLATFSGAPSAVAQARDPAGAEVLFQQALGLWKTGHFEQACPKFLESQHLDPATGTLIAVATCHERQGRLATAWSEYTEAAGRAKREGRQDRVELASERAEALRPRLSSLEVEVSPDLARLPGLRLWRDETPLGPAVWNQALPIDGGTHTLKVEAEGKVPSSISFEVAREGSHVRVQAPLPPMPRTRPDPLPLSISSAPASVTSTTTADVLGLGLGAAGGVSLAAGGAFLFVALNKKWKANCSGRQCPSPAAAALSREATNWGNAATVMGIGGALLGAASAALYWWGSSDPESTATRTNGVFVNVGAHLTGANVEVSF